MEYRITDKPRTSGNTMSNAVLERIEQIIGNLVHTFKTSTQTYVDEDDQRKGILSATAFGIISKNKRQKDYSPGQTIFGCDVILLIKKRVD